VHQLITSHIIAQLSYLTFTENTKFGFMRVMDGQRSHDDKIHQKHEKDSTAIKRLLGFIRNKPKSLTEKN
jgi:hypothetical protein